MTYDPALPHKNVDGVNVNLTTQEIADLAAASASYAPTPITPDLATQLAAALINNGVLQPTDIEPATLDAVNATLSAANLSTVVSAGISAKPPTLTVP